MATALGAAPGAAFFFSAYEGMKPKLQALNGGKEHPLQHSCAASCGEVAACLVRVPTAVVTQRMQACLGTQSSWPSRSPASPCHASPASPDGTSGGCGISVACRASSHWSALTSNLPLCARRSGSTSTTGRR